MMITKWRTPGRNFWRDEKPRPVNFERETEKTLFLTGGRRVSKISEWDIYHDSEEDAIAFQERVRAEIINRDNTMRIRNAAPALLEALEDMLNQGCGYMQKKSCGCNFYCIHPGDKARAAIAAAKGE